MEAVASMMHCQAAVQVSEASQIGEVRRLATRLAAESGFSDASASNVSITATEIATNLVRHTSGGEILLRTYQDDESAGVELLSIDRGPGMANVAECLEDGFSTAGTAGNGLGAIRRLSHQFDVFSTRPGGTVLFSRIASTPPRSRVVHRTFEWGSVNRPVAGETRCGDTWRISSDGNELALLLADGLGHGPAAADAAQVAATTFESGPHPLPVDYLRQAHEKMRGTRGAALALAHVNAAAGSLTYAGIGNIAGSLRSRRELNGRGLVSHNGTAGVEVRKFQQFDYECPAEVLLIMHSDGLQTRWSLEPYPGLINRHPAVVAGVLYRDFTRGRDDVTVCAVRISTNPSASQP